MSSVYTDKDLKQLQACELEMLKVFDKICKDNNLKYSLCSGTLLGAVRHKGFIPWDDDLDVRMTRENYDRFLEIWEKIKPEGYTIQNKENTPNFPQSFTKIRKNDTAFIQYEWEKGAYNTGIFIDIFPLDRIPRKKISKLLFIFRNCKYLIYTRENLHSITNKFLKFMVAFIMKVTTANHRMKYRERFMCFKKWHECLSTQFGDYMQLPPLEERTWSHHPIVIDFEHSWKD